MATTQNYAPADLKKVCPRGLGGLLKFSFAKFHKDFRWPVPARVRGSWARGKCPDHLYHSLSGISKSRLSGMDSNPERFLHEFLHPVQKSTTAMIKGSISHLLALQPRALKKYFIEAPYNEFRSAEARAWKAGATEPGDEEEAGKQLSLKEKQPQAFVAGLEHRGKLFAKPGELNEHRAMAKKLRDSELAQRVLGSGEAEVGLFWWDEDLQLQLKGRLDWVTTGNAIVDYKTTEDASPVAWGRTVGNFGLIEQAAYYLDLWNLLHPGNQRTTWVWLVQERTAPYCIASYYALPEEIDAGRKLYQKKLLKIVECRNSGVWPAYGDELQPCTIPAWYLKTLDEA